ncbi:MAG: alanine racemase [Desulfuromonadales bacterium]|jgi:alanine racemase|nr:alanine racemase [Desulfuromonadales bacterium]
MDFLRPTWVEVDLDALRHNLSEVRRVVGDAAILAVVKADAYGHGVDGVVPALVDAGVDMFGVALVEEGVELRRLGVRQPILVLGGVPPGGEAVILEHDLQPALSDLVVAGRLNAAARSAGRTVGYHLKVDTGMGRLGIRDDQLDEALPALQSMQNLEMVGLMSHLAVADEPERSFTETQCRRFRTVMGQVEDAGFNLTYRHIANSAGLFSRDLADYNLVRPGIVLYGGLTGPFFDQAVSQQPVMRFVSQIALLKQMSPGEGISYGHRFTTDRPSLIAAVPVGYADGYNRLLSNRGEVLVRGQRAPVAGTVCMDWILVDVTDVPGAQAGDQVTLLGCDGGECITAEAWAETVGSITYEVFCGISKRVPRVYKG